MARNKLGKWISRAAGVALLGMLGGPLPSVLPAAWQLSQAFAQTPARAGRAHNALTSAVDCYRRGDYEQAALLLDQAQAGVSELSEAERQDLASYTQRNSQALAGRREGTEQLRKAEQAMKDGRPMEAGDSLKRVAANRDYLSVEDKTKFAQLNDRVQPRTASSGPATPPNNSILARTKLQQARGLLAKANFDAADQLAHEAESLNVTYASGEDTPRKVREDIARSRGDARFLFTAARTAFQRGELDRADQLAQQADKAGNMLSFPVWGDTPGKLRHEIEVARTKAPAPRKESTTATAMGSTSASTSSSMSLPPGNQLAASGDKKKEWWENEAGTKPSTKPTQTASTSPTPPEDAHQLLKMAREKYATGRLDEAMQLAQRAKAAPSAKWGIFEDTPDSLISDIDKAHAQHDRDESVRILAEARKQYEQGDLDGARKGAYRALKLHGPYSILDLGDRPQRLIAEIDSTEAKTRQVKVPPVPPAGGSQVAKQPPVGTTNERNTTVPSAVRPAEKSPITLTSAQSMTSSPKQRAQQLVADARQLQSQGMLIEARQKLQEAQKVGANFSLEEDSPENALVQLNAQAYRKVVGLMDAAEDLAKGGNRPRAEENLKQARQVAIGFGFDTMPIDHKIAWIQQGASAAPGTATVSSPAANENSPGAKLLAQARQELRCGQTHNARKMAVAVYKDHPECKVEAEQLLRSVDQEEFNQKCLEVARNFDAGLNAYRQKDYAFASKIFASVDVHLLDRDRAGKLNDIMMSPEMQNQVVQVKNSVGSPRQIPGAAGVATAQDPSLPTAPISVSSGQPTEQDLLKQAQAMQVVQFQKLRDQGKKIMSEALDRAQAGDAERALELLQDYLNNLGQTSLAPEQIAMLRRPVEARAQQMRTLKAQQELEVARKNNGTGKQFNPAERMQAEQHKQQKVAELMSQYQAFFRDGKYVEAQRSAQLAADLDPDNAAAAAAIQIARVQSRLVSNKKDLQERDDWNLEEMKDDRGPHVTPRDPIHIDPEIHKLASARKGMERGISTLIKTPVEKEIEHRLSAPANIKFTDTPLKKAIEDLKTWNNINIFLDEAALQEEGINPTQPMSFSSDNISLRSALNLMLSQLHLTHVIKDESLIITTEKNAHGNFVRKIYQVTDLVFPVRDAPTPAPLGIQPTTPNGAAANSFGTPGGPAPYIGPFGLQNGPQVGSASSGSLSGPMSQQSGGTTITRQRPGNSIEGELISLIKNSVSPTSWDDHGGKGSIDYYPLGQALVISQTPDIQEQVADLLAALRRLQDVEVAVEIRFITLDEGFFERIGVDFNMNIKTNTTRFQPQITSGNFAPNGFINSPNFNNFVAGLQPGGVFTSDLDIPIRTGSFGLGAPPTFGGFNGAFPSGGLDVGLAFLSDIQVFLFLEAVQGDTRTNIMQAPKLMMFNGQSATLTVTDTQLFVTGVTITPVNGQVVSVPQVTPLPTGLTMILQPIVSADRRFVRLGVTQSINNLASATVPLFPIVVPLFPDFNGGGTGEPVLITQFIQLPVTTGLTVTTDVLVPDGGTVMMGGFKRLSEGRNEYGPPVLSKIPYLNRLFRNEGFSRETESLMMMVTPRIIITEEEELRQTGVPPAPPLPF